MTPVRIAADIGGTFTDLVLDDGARQHTAKVLTSYSDPADAVLQGLGQVMASAGCAPEALGLFLHGTTLATNALIERRGAVTALLTTEGHRDAVEMAFENRFEQYDINIDRPAPLVPRRLRIPVRERIAADGGVLKTLDTASLNRALDGLEERQVESVAIGFLHAYRNPEHEQRTAAAVRERLPGASVTLSSEVCPEIREYERLSTTCANAYVQPLMGSLLGQPAKATSRRRHPMPAAADDLRRRPDRHRHRQPISRSPCGVRPRRWRPAGPKHRPAIQLRPGAVV